MAEDALMPERWHVPDRFTIADLGGGRAAVIDLELLEVHEIAAAGVDLLHRGRLDGDAPAEHVEFLRFALDGGWIVPAGGAR